MTATMLIAGFPAFLQVLRPVEDVADEWASVSGGQVSAVRDEVGTVKREVDALAAEMKEMKAEIRAEMKANQELLMEQLRSMATQKADR